MQIFKMWNKELYVREQQDAYEFFTSLVDQLDEHLKVQRTRCPLHTRVYMHSLKCVCNSPNVSPLQKIGREQIFKNTFQGIFSDQKICKDCPHRWALKKSLLSHPHVIPNKINSSSLLKNSGLSWCLVTVCRYEREETFMALNLGVTSCQSLEISLDQFVRGEVLDGSNAYYCEKCKEKVQLDTVVLLDKEPQWNICTFVLTHFVLQRTTVKRTCIKSLPSVLVIHLMRFGFDWESGRSIKYDEQIRVRALWCHVVFGCN